MHKKDLLSILKHFFSVQVKFFLRVFFCVFALYGMNFFLINNPECNYSAVIKIMINTNFFSTLRDYSL